MDNTGISVFKEKAAKKLEEFLSGRKLLPPLTLEELEKIADEFIAYNPEFESFRELIIIETSNHAWRPVVMSVPYENRLLLLPQCLRKVPGCKGDFDELGLICAGCGACSICAYLKAADAVGMMSLVAEGSAVIDKIMENDDIHAVIGVGCMESLKKAFPKMTESAVPGIAIPLDCAGCMNTTVDSEILMSAINAGQKGKYLNPILIKKQVKKLFTTENIARICGSAHGESEAIARSYVAEHGKRYRPYLVAASYLALSGEDELPQWVGDAALSIEFFHKASLVHDDIEDSDDTRDGVQTLHSRYGIPMALNIGDLLVGEGYRVISNLAAPSEKIRVDLLKTASHVHRDLCIGQGREFEILHGASEPTEEDLTGIAALKTGKAFEAALAFGLICAGGYDERKEMIAGFCRCLGIAYQIRDDLFDFNAETKSRFSMLGIRSRADALALYAQYRAEVASILSTVTHPGLKLLLFQVTGRILCDVVR